jgi:magnesium transporter
MNRTRLYRNGALVEENFPPSEISERLATDGQAFVWLDLYQPTPDDLAMLADECGLHRLAVADAVHERQRPKLDRYETHLFLAAYAVRCADGLTFHEMCAFITERALITVRKDEGLDINELTARWDENPELGRHGVSFLLHGLLDVLVDEYFAAVQRLDGWIEELENVLFAEGGAAMTDIQRRSFDLRRNLVRLRQVALPMREVVNSAIRPTQHVVGQPMLPYYQDVYDHVLRVIDWTESIRDLITTVLETNLSMQNNRMNIIVKKVTSWAAIIAVPTLVTSFYGQNVPYPGFGQRWGFIESTIISAGLAGVLYALFRRKGWL